MQKEKTMLRLFFELNNNVNECMNNWRENYFVMLQQFFRERAQKMMKTETIEIERLDPGCVHTFTVYNWLLSKESVVSLFPLLGRNVIMIVHSISDGQMGIKIMNAHTEKTFSGLLRFLYIIGNDDDDATIQTANNF
jgi:hypothetical protein